MRGAHVSGNFARRVFCKRLKFPQNSPPCRVPCQFHRTLSHSHIFTVDRLQLSSELPSATTFRGHGLSLDTNHIIASYLISCNRPLCNLLLLSSFSGYLALSPPTWQLKLPLSVPCLQLPPNWDCADTPCHLQSPALSAYDNSLPKENLLVRKRLNLACLLLTSLSFYIVSKPNKSVV